MYRVGILGTENSHALAFTQIFNDANSEYPDFKVTALYGLTLADSENIASKFDGITIYDSPEAMVDNVDCVMVTFRHGKYHKPAAMPFIKAGKPAFIDKPFTICKYDAMELIETAAKYNVPLSGGSGCKYSKELVELKEEIAAGKIGTLKNAVMTFAAEMQSPYGGFYFYGSHLADMCVEAFGCDIKSVSAFVKNGHLSAVVRYDALDVYLSFATSYTAIAYGDKGNIFKTISTNDIYKVEVGHFTEMVKTGVSPLSSDQLLKPVLLLNAIEESLTQGHEIFFI